MKHYLLLLSMFLAGYVNAQGANIIIDKGVDNPTRIAVDDFYYTGAKLSEDIGAIIRNDLNFSGLFESIPPDRLITHPRSESEIRYHDFKTIKA